jgi:hypothetical protein
MIFLHDVPEEPVEIPTTGGSLAGASVVSEPSVVSAGASVVSAGAAVVSAGAAVVSSVVPPQAVNTIALMKTIANTKEINFVGFLNIITSSNFQNSFVFVSKPYVNSRISFHNYFANDLIGFSTLVSTLVKWPCFLYLTVILQQSDNHKV